MAGTDATPAPASSEGGTPSVCSGKAPRRKAYTKNAELYYPAAQLKKWKLARKKPKTAHADGPPTVQRSVVRHPSCAQSSSPPPREQSPTPPQSSSSSSQSQAALLPRLAHQWASSSSASAPSSLSARPQESNAAPIVAPASARGPPPLLSGMSFEDVYAGVEAQQAATAQSTKELAQALHLLLAERDAEVVRLRTEVSAATRERADDRRRFEREQSAAREDNDVIVRALRIHSDALQQRLREKHERMRHAQQELARRSQVGPHIPRTRASRRRRLTPSLTPRSSCVCSVRHCVCALPLVRPQRRWSASLSAWRSGSRRLRPPTSSRWES